MLLCPFKTRESILFRNRGFPMSHTMIISLIAESSSYSIIAAVKIH
jgi:hypothetical protein